MRAGCRVGSARFAREIQLDGGETAPVIVLTAARHDRARVIDYRQEDNRFIIALQLVTRVGFRIRRHHIGRFVVINRSVAVETRAGILRRDCDWKQRKKDDCDE